MKHSDLLVRLGLYRSLEKKLLNEILEQCGNLVTFDTERGYLTFTTDPVTIQKPQVFEVTDWVVQKLFKLGWHIVLMDENSITIRLYDFHKWFHW